MAGRSTIRCRSADGLGLGEMQERGDELDRQQARMAATAFWPPPTSIWLAVFAVLASCWRPANLLIAQLAVGQALDQALLLVDACLGEWQENGFLRREPPCSRGLVGLAGVVVGSGKPGDGL